MISETVYAVVNASAGTVPDDQLTAFFGNRGDAVTWRDRYGNDDVRVYRMEPLPESAHWEWAVDRGCHGPMEYVSERAARNCVGGGKLLRRRAGTSEWESTT